MARRRRVYWNDKRVDLKVRIEGETGFKLMNIKEFAESFNPPISRQAVINAIEKGIVDAVGLENTTCILMSDKTKEYTPTMNKRRDAKRLLNIVNNNNFQTS